jgi:plasmid stabilization system protein ParE
MSKLQVELHPEALNEFTAALEWYRERSEWAASTLFNEFEIALSAVVESPERWPSIEPGLRRYPLRRFPYFIIYRHRTDLIEVIAVAHARRRPGYWRSR